MLASDYFTDFDDPNPNPAKLLNPDTVQSIGANENDEGLCIRFTGRGIATTGLVSIVVTDPVGNPNTDFTGLSAQVVRFGEAAIVGFDFPASPILGPGDWYFRFRILEGARTWDSSLIWVNKGVT